MLILNDLLLIFVRIRCIVKFQIFFLQSHTMADVKYDTEMNVAESSTAGSTKNHDTDGHVTVNAELDDSSNPRSPHSWSSLKKMYFSIGIVLASFTP
jgi:hypothetical protein